MSAQTDHHELLALSFARVRRLCRTGEARALRETAQLYLREVAETVGVAESTVSRWECAEQPPTGAAALRYLEVLDGLRAAQERAVPGRQGAVLA